MVLVLPLNDDPGGYVCYAWEKFPEHYPLIIHANIKINWPGEY